MTLSQQILWGSLCLGACFVLEILFLGFCIHVMRRFFGHKIQVNLALRAIGVSAIALAFIVLAHTVQVWLWATAWVLVGALPDWNTSIYFSLVTFTTLGYGDIVLGPGLRIFAAFSAVTGLLAFGLSTAFLVALLGRVLNQDHQSSVKE